MLNLAPTRALALLDRARARAQAIDRLRRATAANASPQTPPPPANGRHDTMQPSEPALWILHAR